jgi:hypothetical protein
MRVIHIGGGDETTRTYRRQHSQVLYTLHITCLSRSSFFWKKQETMMFRSGCMKHSPQNLIFPHLNHKFPVLIKCETERLSLWELYERNLEERLLYWGPRRIC